MGVTESCIYIVLQSRSRCSSTRVPIIISMCDRHWEVVMCTDQGTREWKPVYWSIFNLWYRFRKRKQIKYFAVNFVASYNSEYNHISGHIYKFWNPYPTPVSPSPLPPTYYYALSAQCGRKQCICGWSSPSVSVTLLLPASDTGLIFVKTDTNFMLLEAIRN
jgi:hypothetical protein